MANVAPTKHACALFQLNSKLKNEIHMNCGVCESYLGRGDNAPQKICKRHNEHVEWMKTNFHDYLTPLTSEV